MSKRSFKAIEEILLPAAAFFEQLIQCFPANKIVSFLTMKSTKV
jgi:hypothetical protein